MEQEFIFCVWSQELNPEPYAYRLSTLPVASALEQGLNLALTSNLLSHFLCTLVCQNYSLDEMLINKH